MTNLVLKQNPKKCRYGQRMHRVMDGDRIIGTLYDNRDCEVQKTTFVFLPNGVSEFTGVENTDYIIHAHSVRGEDLTEVLALVRKWYEDREALRLKMKADFDAVLANLPVPEYTMTEEYKDVDTFYCNILGPNGCFRADLSLDEMAKLFGHSYTEVGEYQTNQFSTIPGKTWGCKWYYWPKGDTIELGTYSKYTIMSIKRSEAHKANDAKYW